MTIGGIHRCELGVPTPNLHFPRVNRSPCLKQCSQTSVRQIGHWTGQAPKARWSSRPRHRERWGAGRGHTPPRRGRDLGRGLDHLPRIFLLFDLKMEHFHFGAVFKLDLTEETTTQLPPFASYWLHLYGYHTITSVPAKWHLIPSNVFSRVHLYDVCDRRHTDGQGQMDKPQKNRSK